MKLFDTIKKFLFPKRKEELYYALEEILTVAPHDLNVYKTALLHRSLTKTDGNGHMVNNERLEYLGDAVLETVVSDYLYHKYPNQQEGFLTTMRSKIVRRNTLGLLSTRMGLDRLIKTNIMSGGHNSYIGGNAFEALFGALYIDRGYACCQAFFLSLIKRKYLNPDRLEQKEQNFKSLLLEWCQKYKVNIDFVSEEVEVTNGEKKPPFSTNIVMEGHVMGSGKGYSKKESHQQAARRVLQRLKERPRVAEHMLEDRYARQVLEDMLTHVEHR